MRDDADGNIKNASQPLALCADLPAAFTCKSLRERARWKKEIPGQASMERSVPFIHVRLDPGVIRMAALREARHTAADRQSLPST